MQFKTEPYAHQFEAFERFKDAPYFALFADMGTGKSKIAIDVCAHNYLERRVNACLVIAPNNVHTQWIKEQFPLHCPIPWRPWLWKSGKQSNKRYGEALDVFLGEPISFLKVFAVNVEAFQSESVVPYVARFVQNHECFIIIDEATRIKNRGARRTKTIHKLQKYGVRCVLTGTPTAKSPFDLWSQMEFLKANYFDCGYFVFQHRYGIMMQGVNPFNGGRYTTLIDEKTYGTVKSKLKKITEMRGSAGLMPDDYETVATMMKISEKSVQYIATHPEYTRFKRLDELKVLIAKDVYSVRKEDCLDLPPKVYEKLYVDMSPEQTRIYKNLKTELLAQYDGKEVTVANKVALTTRLMQVVGGFFPFQREQTKVVGSEHFTVMVADGQAIGDENVKLRAILDDLEEVSDETRVIVWAHFVAELKMLKSAFEKAGYRTALYYGGTSQDERHRITEDFQAGKYKVFVGNAQTAGFGLNLQNATLQYFFSNTFRVEDRLQAEDRSHRIGTLGTVVYKDVLAKGTIDEKIFANIAAGRDLNDFFKTATLKELLTDTEEDEDVKY